MCTHTFVVSCFNNTSNSQHSSFCKQLTRTSGSKCPASEYCYSCVVAHQYAIGILQVLPFICSLSMLLYRYTFSTYGHTLSWVGSREQEPKTRPLCLLGESYQNPQLTLPYSITIFIDVAILGVSMNLLVGPPR